jgi:ribonuclease III
VRSLDSPATRFFSILWTTAANRSRAGFTAASEGSIIGAANSSPMSEPLAQPWQDPEWLSRAEEFARSLAIPAEHVALVHRAVTHRSLADVSPHGDLERLEFLGDSVLALLVNDYLFHKHPDASEGRLTKLKARYVSEPSLAQAAEALGLGSLLLVGPADEISRTRSSTLSDLFEAVLAALYLARGLEAAGEFVLRELVDRVDPDVIWDYKSRLQELLQEKQGVVPTYQTEVESGPAHDRMFRSHVVVEGVALGEGVGRSKKLAEQAAAAEALAVLEKPAKKARKKPAAGTRKKTPKADAKPAADAVIEVAVEAGKL